MCPFCFATLESTSALRHVDCECAALSASGELDESQFAELSSDLAFWDRLERLHQNGYLAPLVADAVPTAAVPDDAAPSRTVVVKLSYFPPADQAPARETIEFLKAAAAWQPR